MKKLLLLIFLLGNACWALAQDILIKRSGEQLQVKVLEITPELIKFIPFHNQESPIISFYRRDVAEIKYENGVVEKFNLSPQEIQATALKSQTLRKNALALNVLPLVAASFNVFYDRPLEHNPKIALSLGLGFYAHEEDYFFKDTNKQFTITGAAKFYISESDFYFSPYLKYRHFASDQTIYDSQTNLTTTVDLNYNQFGGGATFGARHVFKSGFLIDSFLGLGGYALEHSNTSVSHYYSSPNSMDVRLGIALGFAF